MSTPPTLSTTFATSLASLLPRPPPTTTNSKGKQRALDEADRVARLARDEELLKEVGEYQQRCELLKDQLRRAVEEADDAAGQSGKANGSRGSAATSIEAKRLLMLEEEVAQLEATLDHLRSDPTPSDPLHLPSATFVRASLPLEVTRIVSELEAAQVWEQKRLDKEKRKHERDLILLQDAVKLNAGLTEALDKAQEEAKPLTGDELLSRAKAKSKTLSNSVSTLMNALITFIDERLAGIGGRAEEEEGEVGEEERKARKKALKAGMKDVKLWFRAAVDDDEDFEEVLQERALVFKRLLETLMNKAVTDPENPYVLLSSTIPKEGSEASFAPTPLVDFLFRAHVVSAHPLDERRLRLVKWE